MIRIRTIVAPLVSAMLCFVLAVAMIRLLSFERNLASVWPANAVVVAQLIGRSRGEWWRFIVAAFGAIIAAGFVTRGTLIGPIGFAVANCFEIFLAAWLLRGAVDGDGRLLHRHASVGRFAIFAGLIAPICGATLGALIATISYGLPFGISLVTKFSADSLGLLIFTPFFYGLFRGDYLANIRSTDWKERAKILALYSGVLIVSIGVFWQDRFPILFMPLAPLMLLSFRQGWQGTSLGVMMLAVVGGVATFYGHGPVNLSGQDMGMHMVFLQVYLGTVLIVMMPVAAALATRRDLIDRLSESDRSLKLLADRSSIVLLRFSDDGACTRVVGNARLLLGEGVQFLQGAHLGELEQPMGDQFFAAHLQAADRDGPVTVEVERPGQGWVEATFRAERDEQGIMTGSVATLMDVTVRKAREGELARLAETDELTGLINRAGFLRRFDAALAAPPSEGISIALIDVDRFKSLNDELGHVAGDAALAEVGRRIAGNLRSSDLVARLGGDEFVVLLGTANPQVAREICMRIVASVSAQPVQLPLGGEAQAQISCGLVHRVAGQDGIDLLNRADMALYEAKRGGRNRLIAA